MYKMQIAFPQTPKIQSNIWIGPVLDWKYKVLHHHNYIMWPNWTMKKMGEMKKKLFFFNHWFDFSTKADIMMLPTKTIKSTITIHRKKNAWKSDKSALNASHLISIHYYWTNVYRWIYRRFLQFNISIFAALHSDVKLIHSHELVVKQQQIVCFLWVKFFFLFDPWFSRSLQNFRTLLNVT